MKIQVVPSVLAVTAVVSSCHWSGSETCVCASPAYPLQATESRAVAGVYNKVAYLVPSSSSSGSGSRPTIVKRNQLIKPKDEESIPQAKQQQQQGGIEEEYTTSAVSSSIDVQIVTSYVASTVQPSLSSALASTTPGSGGVAAGVVQPPSSGPGGFGACPPPAPWNRKRTAGSPRTKYAVRDDNDGPPCPNPGSPPPPGPGPGAMNATRAIVAVSTGVQPPPPVALWLLCVLMAIEVAWVIILRVQSWVAPCLGRKARGKQPASGDDTLEESNASTTVSRNASGSSSLEHFKNLLSFLFKLLQPTALPAASCVS